jgi:hypothetical protein
MGYDGRDLVHDESDDLRFPIDNDFPDTFLQNQLFLFNMWFQIYASLSEPIDSDSSPLKAGSPAGTVRDSLIRVW